MITDLVNFNFNWPVVIAIVISVLGLMYLFGIGWRVKGFLDDLTVIGVMIAAWLAALFWSTFENLFQAFPTLDILIGVTALIVIYIITSPRRK